MGWKVTVESDVSLSECIRWREGESSVDEADKQLALGKMRVSGANRLIATLIVQWDRGRWRRLGAGERASGAK